MKKTLILSVLAFAAFSANAQEKTIKFDKKLEYVSSSKDYEGNVSEQLYLNDYYAAAAKMSLFETTTLYSPEYATYSVISNGKLLKLAGVTLDGGLKKLNSTSAYVFQDMERYTKVLSANMKLVKMDKKGKFGSFSCDYYSIEPNEELNSEYGSDFLNTVCFCIDTNNKVKNLKSILPNTNADGLIVAFAEKENEDNVIYLKSINEADVNVKLDFEKEYNTFKEAYAQYEEELNQNVDSAAVATTEAAVAYTDNYYDDPLCNYYTYFSELNTKLNYFANNLASSVCYMKNLDLDYDGTTDITRDQAIVIAEKQTGAALKQARKDKVFGKNDIKSLQKAFDKMFAEAKKFKPSAGNEEVNVDYAVADAAEAVAADAAAVAYDASDMYRQYSSDYKQIKIDAVNLAAEMNDYGDISAYMPDYCTDLKSKVPGFKDETLKKHVHNLVGQMCDLYLYQNGAAIDYYGTIDSMRKSLLEIENMREKLNKSDAKLLKDFLNSLD